MVRAYANGKIYCIRNRAAGDGIVYIGSTVQPLCERMRGHRGNMKDTPERPLYKLMNEVGVEHFHIELVVNFPCESKAELEREEGRHIRLHRPVGNAAIAGRTQREYDADKRDTIAERKKEHYAAHRLTVLARQKEYKVGHPEIVAASAKAYRAAHSEAIAARAKVYRAAHSEAIAARHKAQYEANREAAIAGAKARYEANREAIAAYKRAYRERKKAEWVAVQGPNVENVTN